MPMSIQEVVKNIADIYCRQNKCAFCRVVDDTWQFVVLVDGKEKALDTLNIFPDVFNYVYRNKKEDIIRFSNLLGDLCDLLVNNAERKLTALFYQLALIRQIYVEAHQFLNTPDGVEPLPKKHKSDVVIRESIVNAGLNNDALEAYKTKMTSVFQDGESIISAVQGDGDKKFCLAAGKLYFNYAHVQQLVFEDYQAAIALYERVLHYDADKYNEGHLRALIGIVTCYHKLDQMSDALQTLRQLERVIGEMTVKSLNNDLKLDKKQLTAFVQFYNIYATVQCDQFVDGNSGNKICGMILKAFVLNRAFDLQLNDQEHNLQGLLNKIKSHVSIEMCACDAFGYCEEQVASWSLAAGVTRKKHHDICCAVNKFIGRSDGVSTVLSDSSTESAVSTSVTVVQ